MAEKKYLEKVERLFEKSSVVLFSDVNRIIKSNKDTEYAKQLLNNLVKKGKINRITKGCYTKFDEISLSVLCFKPSYLGLQSALSFHGLWEQETIPVIITSNNIRQGLRECMSSNIFVRKSQKDYVFGFDYLDDSGYYLPYSDIEKTFIDFFVFREKLSDEVIKNFKKRIDFKKLDDYLKRYPERIRVKVFNSLK